MISFQFFSDVLISFSGSYFSLTFCGFVFDLSYGLFVDSYDAGTVPTL